MWTNIVQIQLTNMKSVPLNEQKQRPRQTPFGTQKIDQFTLTSDSEDSGVVSSDIIDG